MPDTRTQIVGMKDIRERRPRMPQRSRLGSTWQDRCWRGKLVAKLVGQVPSGMFRADDSEPANNRALPSRH